MYASERRLSDEHVYVLNRRDLTTRPGNMLPRPSLLLQRKILGDTETVHQVNREGGAYANQTMASDSEQLCVILFAPLAPSL